MKGQSSDGLAFFIWLGNRKIRSQLVADSLGYACVKSKSPDNQLPERFKAGGVVIVVPSVLEGGEGKDGKG